MRLLRIQLHNVGPFDDAVLRLTGTRGHETEVAPPEPGAPERGGADDDLVDGDPTSTEDSLAGGAPRAVTVLFGGDGTGKTSLLSALSLTRPGHTLPPLPLPPLARERERPPGEPPRASWVATRWLLGEDDPSRPHPLIVASPAALFPGETTETAGARRREQALFDRRAQADGGHVFVAFSGARWFSRVSNMLSVPERTILRYDVRQPSATFDDPTRADLTRETKQILSYAVIGAALGGDRAEFHQLALFAAALREVVDVVLEPFDLVHAGVSPTSLEPQFRSARGGLVPFDALPRAARHLIAFVALPLRALSAAYPGEGVPREREGVVAIDDLESQQDPALLRSVVPLLRRALPSIQWIVTTSSTQLALACDASEVVALRRASSSTRVELGEGLLH